jgi:hypothetical protein
MEPIRPIGAADRSTPAVPAVKPLTREQREQAAEERRRRRRAREPTPRAADDPPSGGGPVDVRA